MLDQTLATLCSRSKRTTKNDALAVSEKLSPSETETSTRSKTLLAAGERYPPDQGED